MADFNLDTDDIFTTQRIIEFLEENKATTKSFLLFHTKPDIWTEDAIDDKHNDLRILPGNHHIETNSDQIKLFVTRVDHPAEYSIDTSTDDATMAIFVPDKQDNSNFHMLAYNTAETPHVRLRTAPGECFRWDKIRNTMLSTLASGAFSSSNKMSSEVQDRFDVLRNDVSILLDNATQTTAIMQYLDVLFEAMQRYFQTNQDKLVFLDIVSRRDFLRVERLLRKHLWNREDVFLQRLSNQLTINAEELGKLPISSDTQALQGCINVLKGFILDLHPVDSFLQAIQLDPERIVETTRSALNKVIRVASGTCAVMDPLSDLFVSLSDTEICRSARKPVDPDQLLHMVLDRLMQADFTKKILAAREFIKDFTPEGRRFVRTSCRRVIALIRNASFPVYRSIDLICEMTARPDAAVTNLVAVALKLK